MTSSRPPSHPGERRLWRRRGRPAGLLGLTLMACTCALVACAFLVPGLVLGADASMSGPGPEIVVETTAPFAAEATTDRPDASATAPEDATSATVDAEADDSETTTGAVTAVGVLEVDAVLSEGSLLVTLPWGNGEAEVGLVRPEEGRTYGPQALAVAPDGRIAVLDSVNRRVLFLNAQGGQEGTATVALAEPRFLAVDDDRVYVLDCDDSRKLVTLDWSGATHGATALPRLTDVVTGLFATTAGPCLEVAHEKVFLTAVALRATAELENDADVSLEDTDPALSLVSIAGRPVGAGLARVASVTYQPGDVVRINFVALDGGTLEPTGTTQFTPTLARGLELEHLVSVDGGEGVLIVGARLLDPISTPSGDASLALTLLRINSDGTLDDNTASTLQNILYLADSPFAYLGLPYTVAPDGRVFQPVASEAGYSILVHTFSSAEVQP